ncbi:Subtilisin-like protease SBT4.14 [Striga hermonthica]|uniref:Subtilisin-like protease SBT4.14 n=1 Tax=Striga hermonthica TaxID=68872 RepID=A0A9N7RHA8_STRHE|nr:Subtilisin-like protease SBT4.14 [Striga hermonthica]
MFNDGLSLGLLLLSLVFTRVLAENGNDFYIVFLRDQTTSERPTLVETHLNILSSLKGSEDAAAEALAYSYTKSFNAFAAKLSEDEGTKLSSMDKVASVFQNRYRKLHTTRSWDFLRLTQQSKRNLEVESDIIVGMLDSGISPDSESFNDQGFGPPPKKWKGSCPKAANFSGCNNKLIGAKYYKIDKQPDPNDILSPVDMQGHGTHTSSTAAGSAVKRASLFGIGEGTARGAVPSARVAMYKVCWGSGGCADMDLLAAFDDAIHDGVDVISLSLGGYTGRYNEDVISIGAFRASSKGILTVASAGNSGPDQGSVTNHAPWILTVAASGIDRQFRSRVLLGNGATLSGIGISPIEPKQDLYPLASGADVASDSRNKEAARSCYDDSMDPKKVKGKIIYCFEGTGRADSIIKGLGGIGAIIEGDSFSDTGFVYMAPATVVNSTVGNTIEHYMNSTKKPSAVVHKTEEFKISAPVVASFSSRGPNPGSQHLLKPDITAPGIDILAAYTPLRTITGRDGDKLYSKFSVLSGTSMSCPHVSGAAAYVKSFHPDWSPAAIKSAILTTARPMSTRVDKDAEFAYGTGQVYPNRAINPGLVYDMDDMSYIQFLCHENYSGSAIGTLTGRGTVDCSKLAPASPEDALNYPTMQLALKTDQEATVAVFQRTVTNVGPPGSVYNATIQAPKGVVITVKPTKLSFSEALQKKSFKVVVTAKPMSNRRAIASGLLTWESTDIRVRSPIVVFNPYATQDRNSEINDHLRTSVCRQPPPAAATELSPTHTMFILHSPVVRALSSPGHLKVSSVRRRL